MNSVKTAVVYGVLVWLIVFAIAFLMFPLRESNRPLFESLMPVVLSICVVFFSILYLSRTGSGFLKEGVALGLIWLAISLLVDAPMFLIGGPMKMTVSEYVSDVGITYLMIPVITAGLGYLLQRRKREN